jgi:hypothetical protein
MYRSKTPVYSTPGLKDIDITHGSERQYIPDAVPEMLNALDNYEKNPSDENYDEVHKKSDIYRVYFNEYKSLIPYDTKLNIKNRIDKIVDAEEAKLKANGGSSKKSKKSKRSRRSMKSKKFRKTKSRRH